MTVNIVPYTLPPIRNRRQQHRRPWNIEPSCVLGLMPEINTKWLDYSNYGNDGTRSGATLRHNGRFGPCLYFDGLNDYVEITDHASLDMTGAMGITAWVKLHALPAAWKIVAQKKDMYLLGVGAVKKFVFRIRDSLGNYVYSPYSLIPSLNIWYHIAGVYDTTAGKIRLYINGDEYGVATAFVGDIGFDLTNNLYVGCTSIGTNHINATIDEVLVFNRAPEAWEIKALYEQGAPGGT